MERRSGKGRSGGEITFPCADKKVTACSAGIWHAPATGRIKPETTRPGLEIVEIILGGVVIFDEGPEPREYGRGAIFWHVAGDRTIHRFRPGCPYRCLVIHFTVEGAERSAPRVSEMPEEMLTDGFIDEVIDRSNDSGILTEVWSNHLYQTLRWRAYTGMLDRRKAEYPDDLRSMVEEIEKDPCLFARTGELFSACRVSKSTAYRLFQQYFHCPPHTYILRRRLRKAGTLLVTTTLCIKEISDRCGFANVENFYRAFKGFYRTTPVNYRKRMHRQ